MKLVQVIVEALRSMAANRLRTALTMLGIVIGIASVVLMMALGDTMQRFVKKEMEALGTNMVYVFPGGDRTEAQRMRSGAAPSLTLADAEALNRLGSVRGAAPALQGSFKLAAGNETSGSMVHGVTPAMFKIRNWKIDHGSMFTDEDVRAAARMVVIGQKVADQFFYRLDPLGRYLRIENVSFQVVGVLQGEGRQIDGGDLSEMVLVPITAARAYMVRGPFPDNVHYIAAQGKSEGVLADAVEDMKETLRDRHRIKLDDPDDFRMQNMATFAATGAKITKGIAALLGVIGGISLLVGGIGIMNIMLVSVTERTREIGIRMAIGAKPRDILLQFLVEAVVICLAGAVVGIVIAATGAAVITKFANFDVKVGVSAVIVACAFATAVGVFFGFYPARRASRLLPVDCLRHE
jgi:putative ABC transport system permease protein